jgi:hypothetical protein
MAAASSSAPVPLRLQKLLVVPPNVSSLLPSRELSLRQLSEITDLPAIASGLVTRAPKSVLSAMAPTTDIPFIITCAVMPSTWLDRAFQTLYELEISAPAPVLSVAHPSNIGCYSPLWILSFWRRVNYLWAERKGWARFIQHISDIADQEERKSIQILVDHVAWGSSVQAFGISTPISTLRRFLERGYAAWFSTDIIDMCMAKLQHDVDANTGLKGVMCIASMAFMYYVARGDTQHRALDLYVQTLSCDGRVYFMAHETADGSDDPTMKGNHWIPFRIDGRTKTLSYGQPRDT